MNGAFDIAAIGLKSQQTALDILANNIANINTPSFKRSDVRFTDIVAMRSDPETLRAALTTAPVLAGVTAEAVLALNEQGEIERTGRPLDLAIQGPGFIELLGPRGQTMLWRGGALQIQPDGLLAGPDGMPLRAMITVPAEATALSIAADGLVTARTQGGDEAATLGQIRLVQLDDPSAVERLDGGLYRLNDARAPLEAAPGESGMGELIQGALERSNVELSDQMIQLMIVQRSYAANAQVVHQR